jgi:hypothetical protein
MGAVREKEGGKEEKRDLGDEDDEVNTILSSVSMRTTLNLALLESLFWHTPPKFRAH